MCRSSGSVLASSWRWWSYPHHKVGISDATSEEMGEGSHVIALLPEQEGLKELGGTMRLGDYTADIKNGTLAMKLLGRSMITERHRHRYEVDPRYLPDLERVGIVFQQQSERMEVLELP